MLAKHEKRSPGGSKNTRRDERALGVAEFTLSGTNGLRERQDEKRGGNDAPWKAWKTPKAQASFPLFPPGLEIRQKTKAPDSHIPTAPTAGLYQRERTNNEAQTKFQLTDPGPLKHDKNVSVASLRIVMIITYWNKPSR